MPVKLINEIPLCIHDIGVQDTIRSHSDVFCDLLCLMFNLMSSASSTFGDG